VLACVHVRFTDGGEAVYQAPISATATEPVFDALTVRAVRRRLAEAFARGQTITGPDSRWLFESIEALADVASDSELLGGEQSNTSIVFADRATIIKFYRRLEPGPQPDVEISRFLAACTDFRGTPALLGAAHLDGPAGRCVTAIVQEFLPGAVDGWTHVLARLRAAEDVTQELKALGALTRELHDALASDISDPAFAPEPTSDADLQRWQGAAASQADNALTTLAANQPHLPAARLHPEIIKILESRRRAAAPPARPDLGHRRRPAHPPPRRLSPRPGPAHAVTANGESSTSRASPPDPWPSAAPSTTRCATSPACCARSPTPPPSPPRARTRRTTSRPCAPRSSPATTIRSQ
jgi:predicted trehalose synthase